MGTLVRSIVVVTSAALFAIGAGSTGCVSSGDDPLPADDAGSSGNVTLPEGGNDGAVPPNGCGNKRVDQGEECDDGNTADNDGCSSTCKLEKGGPEDVCDGVAIALKQADASTLYTGTVTGSTTKLYNHYTASCGGGSGADAVYSVVAPANGRAKVRITAAFGALLSARTSCKESKTEIGCVDATSLAPDGGAPAEKTLSFPVFANKPTFLFVDGYGGTKGDYTLHVEVQTALCGNGKAEPPETCDDGNTTAGDGCSATCAMEDSATAGACPGMGYRLKPGSVSFAGDTSLQTNANGSAVGCTPSGGGPNVVYAITPTVTGSLTLDLLANYPEALLHVRRECSDNATQFDCRVGLVERTPLSTVVPVTKEETVYVFVDGDTNAHGLYVLDAKLTAAACGNGAVDPGEECDDKNTTAGDGCSPTCTIERDTASYTCPGKPLRLEAAAAGPRTLKVRGTTAPLPGESVPASKFSSCGVSTAPDVVYQVTSDIDGMLTATVGGGLFNATVAVRSACPGTADLACGKAGGGNEPDTVKFAISKETPMFVVVDGATANKSGPFELTLTVDPAVCGNGVVEGGEGCDDGAKADGDGCSATCQLEADTSRDECATAAPITLDPKPGGSFGATVTSGTTNLTHVGPTHTASPCSSTGPDGWYPIVAPIDGVLTATITSATFRTTVAARASCGGAQITCDGTDARGGQEITFPVTAGNTYPLMVVGGFSSAGTQFGRFTMDVKIVPAGCGDTFVTAPEVCDDGNVANGDGCSSTCALETLAGVSACPGHAVTLVGNGAETRRATVTVNTAGLPSNTASACGGSGPEGVLKITPDVSGQLQIRATGFDTVLHVRTTCNDPNTEITKASCSAANLPVVNAPVTKNVPVYVYVDGVNGASGIAKLQITVTP